VKSVVVGFEQRIPLLTEEGWLRNKEKGPFRNGADGVVLNENNFRKQSAANCANHANALALFPQSAADYRNFYQETT